MMFPPRLRIAHCQERSVTLLIPARLIIFRSSRPFPEAAEARELGGTEGAWTIRSSGVTVICAQGTHAMLLLGSDATLVRQAGALHNAI